MDYRETEAGEACVLLFVKIGSGLLGRNGYLVNRHTGRCLANKNAYLYLANECTILDGFRVPMHRGGYNKRG